MALLPGQSMRPSDAENYNQQFVPLLSEQEETDNNTNTDDNSRLVPQLVEHEEESQHLWQEY